MIGGVYFIQCSGSGLIKIGRSDDVRVRLSKMQSDSPFKLNVLGVAHGDAAHESFLHSMFADLRVRGEWFQDDGRIKRHIEEMCAPLPLNERTPKTLDGLSDDQIAEVMCCSRPYVTMMRLGRRAIPIDFSLRLYAETGARIGPIQNATDAEITVLDKFILAPLLATERAA